MLLITFFDTCDRSILTRIETPERKCFDNSTFSETPVSFSGMWRPRINPDFEVGLDYRSVMTILAVRVQHRKNLNRVHLRESRQGCAKFLHESWAVGFSDDGASRMNSFRKGGRQSQRGMTPTITICRPKEETRTPRPPDNRSFSLVSYDAKKHHFPRTFFQPDGCSLTTYCLTAWPDCGEDEHVNSGDGRAENK